MPIPDAIAAIQARSDLDEDGKRREIYSLKTTALIDVILNGKEPPEPIPALLGRTINHKGFHFCINEARMTPANALFLDVTFSDRPAEPVTHQITIVNPPVLPSSRSGSEKQDMIAAIHEMLEGFV